MTQFLLDLKDITSEAKALECLQILLQQVERDGQFNKQMTRDFLTKCLNNFQDQKASPELKFYTLSILKNFDNKDKTVVKIFSLLSSHPLFAYLIQTAKQVDPRKSITQKGKSLFLGNKQLGNKFVRLILESLKLWSERFPQNSKKQKTKYKKQYDLLVNGKVAFPNQYFFYSPVTNEVSQRQKQVKQTTKNQQKRQPQKIAKKQIKQQKQTPQGSSNSNQKQIASQIRFLFSKIEIFIGIIEQQQDIDELHKQIMQYHSLFEKQQKKLQNINIFQGQQQELVNLYLNINEFLNVQRNIFNQQITKNQDLQTYSAKIIIQFQKIFTQEKSKRDNARKSQRPSQKPEKSTIKEKQINKVEAVQRPEKNKMQTSKNRQVQRQDEEKNLQKKQKERNYRKQQQQNQESPQNRNKNKQNTGLKGFFDRHLQNPKKKVPIQGFKGIRESIQKQRQKVKPAHSRASKSPFAASNLSRSKYDASTVSKFKTDGIFSSPPNPHPKYKSYQGQIIPSNLQLQSILDLLNKNQGMRRFKVSNMKNRSLLYENQHIQIGYKNQLIYDGVQQFQQIIQFQLFIGNKSSKAITDLYINFQGDQRSLVYTNPQKPPSMVNPGQQYKFQVFIIPRHQIFGLTSMRMSYRYDYGNQILTSCILPSSMMKFCSYIQADIKQIKQLDSSMNKFVFQSDIFKLSHYFPPKKLINYLQEFVQITDYSQFCENGSQKDYVLAGYFLMKEKYQGLLKINIRPNLNVVIQIKTNQESQEGKKSMKLYIQTLAMVLRQIR